MHSIIQNLEVKIYIV